MVVGEWMEAVGDADVVYSTRLGLKNIRRTVPLLLQATTRDGEDYSDLREVYERLVGQWVTELGHVAALIGGLEGQEKFGGQEGVRFELVPAGRQREAIAFLNEEAFKTPRYLLDPEILRRIETFGALDRIGKGQAHILSRLLYSGSINVLLEAELLAAPGERVYTLTELLRDLRRGIWSELSEKQVKVDAVRRNLQLAYLDIFDEKINPGDTPEYNRVLVAGRSLFRQELTNLDAELRRALGRAGDEPTRAHLQAARARIARILEPRS